MERENYQTLAHRAGRIRKRYRLTPDEAALCVLWLAGAQEEDLPDLAKEMDCLRRLKGKG